MYTPYIFAGYAISLALCLLGFVLIHRAVPDLRGTRPLSIYMLCGLLAVVLMALREQLYYPVAIVAANLLLIAGAVSFYAATAEILAVRSRVTRWLALLPVIALPMFYWYSAHPRIRVRMLVHGCCVGACFAAAAVRLFRVRQPELRGAVRTAAWIISGAVAVKACWMIYPWLFPVQLNFLHPDAVDMAFSYLSMLLGVASGIALIWLALSAQRNDLRRIAQTDSLTGLLNRGAFEGILRRDLQRCDRSGGSVGLMLLDLDYFKQVNDAHGHAVGDVVLRRISIALIAGTRPSDVLARYGGEEFVVLLRGAGLEETRVVAERIRADIAALDRLPENVSLTASIGVTTSQPGESPEEFLHRADEALYRSKREGRNLVSIYRSPRRGSLMSV